MIGNLPRNGMVLTSLTALLIVACGGGDSIRCPGPESEGELSAGIISTDLSVGQNRLAFFLLDSESEPVSVDEVDVTTCYPAGREASEVSQDSNARFRQWPLGGLGVYTTQVNFDHAGDWGLRVETTGTDSSIRVALLEFDVAEQGVTPAIGSPAPATRSKTVRDVASLEELTSSSKPDPELYSMTIAEAIASGRPSIVVFATPAFCTSATCGPQVSVVGDIKDRYKDLANFIHVEMFDNPHEIQGDLSKAIVAPAVGEWGLLTEPWTFIVDSQGLISAKFEAFTTAEEIEESLKQVLR